MKIATLLFTYHRSWHTEQVINSLKQNTVLPQKLFVFQDGLRGGEDVYEWEKVNTLLYDIDWCDREVIISKYNKGLACSIVSGINYALRDYDAVIVLEDDCVTAANYISFMQQCFEKYRENKRVYAVSGYNFPVNMEKTQSDVYGCGRISSWGWGTWKDRWEKYNKDNEILTRLKANKRQSLNLAIWGKNLDTMLIGNMEGKFDSWAVYWALNVIENEGICIYPYDSLIQNIGLDGTGVHCGTSDQLKATISDSLKERFRLPDEIDFSDSAKEKLVNICGSYTAINKEDDTKEKVLIYGLGNFYLQNEREINERYNIRAFVDKRKRGWFAGKKIISSCEIEQYEYDKIIIMIYDVQECINIARGLIAEGINYRYLLLGHNYCGDYSGIFNRISIQQDGSLFIEKGNIGIKVSTKEEFDDVKEIFVNEIYSYFINNDKKDIICDIGMHTGGAVLYFLNNPKVQKIYGYESNKEKYLAAEKNLQEYIYNSERIEIFQYDKINKKDIQLERKCVGKNEEEFIEVKNVAEIILPIIKRYSNFNIVIKIDCRGEENIIIEELLKAGVLNQVSVLMINWYDKGKDDLIRYLRNAGFSNWSNDKKADMGLIFAYKFN